MWPEPVQVVGKYCGFVAGAQNGDVAEAGVKKIRVDFGIGIDQDALGGNPLGDGEARDSTDTEGVSR